MRFSIVEVVLYRMKIIPMNVSAVSRHLGSIPEEQSDLGIFMVPYPEGNSEAGVGVPIFKSNFE